MSPNRMAIVLAPGKGRYVTVSCDNVSPPVARRPISIGENPLSFFVFSAGDPLLKRVAPILP